MRELFTLFITYLPYLWLVAFAIGIPVTTIMENRRRARRAAYDKYLEEYWRALLTPPPPPPPAFYGPTSYNP